MRWMAPEILVQTPSYSFASDVYALGMVFYEILERRLPFAQVSDNSLVANLVRDKAERPHFSQQHNEHLQLLIGKMWDQIPNQRPTTEFVLSRLSEILHLSSVMPLFHPLAKSTEFRVLQQVTFNATCTFQKLMKIVTTWEIQNVSHTIWEHVSVKCSSHPYVSVFDR